MNPDTIKLLFNVALTLFSFFVTAPMILSAVAQFAVQKKLMKRMIENGIIPEDKVNGAKDLFRSKKVAGLAVALIVLVVTVVVAVRNSPWGYICAGVGLILGLLKWRKACQYNSLATKNFKRSYRNFINLERFENFEASEFDRTTK